MTPGTHHTEGSRRGVVQQGLGGQGGQEGQEALVGLAVPFLQGCPQLQPGQGFLGGPEDLKWNQGVGGYVRGREVQGGCRGRDKAAWGSGYLRALEATGPGRSWSRP